MQKLSGIAAGGLLALAAMQPAVAAPPAQKQAAPAARSAKDYDPSTRLLTQDNQPVRFYDDLVKGKVALINTMFTTCPSICPPMMTNLAKVAELLKPYLGKQVVMISVSVDPENDTPAVLKQYAARFHVGPGWYLLTGKRAQVDAVLAKLGDEDPDKNRHSGMLFVGSDPLRSWRKVFAMSAPADIAGAVQALLEQQKKELPAAP